MPVRLMVLALMLIKEGIQGKGINPVIGPYIAYGERFYMCDNGSLPWKWHLRATHFNPYKPKELQRLTGNVTFYPTPFDDNCWGVYELNNVPIDWSFPNVPILPYGHYRFRVMVGMVGRAENQYACWVADARAIPKPE